MKTKKELLEDTKRLAKARGGECLAEEYINSSAKMDFVCAEGHKFISCRGYVQAGTWCSKCSGRGRTIEDMRLLAEGNGGQFLSPYFKLMSEKYLWECKEGHQWDSTAQNIKSGKWCPDCRRAQSDLNRRKYTINDMHKLAAKKGGECLSTLFEGVTKRLTWKCKCGYSWDATPHNIKNGNWCPPCGEKSRREKRTTHSISRAREFAASKGGKCISKKYRGVKNPLEWECSEGHQWKANVDNIINGGKWCPHCSGNVMKTLYDMQALAISRGGECLSKIYSGIHSKMRWKCFEGHEWKAIPSSIMGGSWCSVCSSGLGERICREYFEQLLGERFIKERPDWLRTEKGVLLELDGYSETLGVAFEHQGTQHYKENSYFHKESESFVEQKKRDKRKENLCKIRGVSLIVVPSIPDLLAISDVIPFLKKSFVDAGICYPENIDDITVDLKSVYCPDRLLEIRLIAEDKNGELLSDNYLGVFEKLNFKCQDGHYFSASPTSIKNKGTWCSVCSGKGRTIEDMRELALSRGGKCLSERYIDSSTALQWECDLGHKWPARANNVFFGTWCPTCSKINSGLKRRKHTIECMQELAAKKGGKCISIEYIGYKTRLEWSCSEGHTWERTPEKAMTNKRWCKRCRK